MKTISLFDGSEKFINAKPIRLIELFGGVQAQATALHELGVDFEHYRYVDFDKYAVKSANAMYGTNFEPLDITKISANDLGVVETENYCYIMTYSFPCTDLSLAGKGAGMQKGSGTRSGLLWEVERLLNECEELPQVLLMENVPQVHGKKNIDSFREWQQFLESKGYKNYWQDLNAKNYGIPQNRNRTFMVSLLGNYTYEFPEPIELKLRLRDMLEDNVDDKYYLSDKQIKNVELKHINTDIGKTIRAGGKGSIERHSWDLVQEKVNCIGEISTICINSKVNGKQPSVQDRIYDTSGVSTAITTGFMPSIAEPITVDTDIKQCVRKNYEREKEQIAQSDKEIYQCECKNGFQDNKVGIKVSPTLRAGNSHTAVYNNYRIRKLTAKECWRLMGFRDELSEKAEQVNSNAQLYKQAGNSIVVTVLMAIFGELLSIEWQRKVKNLVESLKEFKVS